MALINLIILSKAKELQNENTPPLFIWVLKVVARREPQRHPYDLGGRQARRKANAQLRSWKRLVLITLAQGRRRQGCPSGSRRKLQTGFILRLFYSWKIFLFWITY